MADQSISVEALPEDSPTLRSQPISALLSATDGLTGAALTGNASTAEQGEWQFSRDAGKRWTSIPTNLEADGSAALLLPADALIRFAPARNFHGTPGALNLRPLTSSNLPWAEGGVPYGNKQATLISLAVLYQDGSGNGIYAQRFNADGSKNGAEFLVNTHTSDSQYQPSVSSLTGGGFLISWQSWGQDGSSNGASTPSASTPMAQKTAANSSSTHTPQTAKNNPASPPSLAAASSSLGSPITRTAVAGASTPSASTPMAQKTATNSSSTPTPQTTNTNPASPPSLAAASSSPGSPLTRTAVTTASTPSASTPMAQKTAANFRSIHTPHRIKTTPASPPSPAAASSSPGPPMARTAVATASTPSATTPMAQKMAANFRSIHTPHRIKTTPASPPSPAAASSSPGSPLTRTAVAGASTPSASTPMAQKTAANFRSIHTPHRIKTTPASPLSRAAASSSPGSPLTRTAVAGASTPSASTPMAQKTAANFRSIHTPHRINTTPASPPSVHLSRILQHWASPTWLIRLPFRSTSHRSTTLLP